MEIGISISFLKSQTWGKGYKQYKLLIGALMPYLLRYFDLLIYFDTLNFDLRGKGCKLCKLLIVALILRLL